LVIMVGSFAPTVAPWPNVALALADGARAAREAPPSLFLWHYGIGAWRDVMVRRSAGLLRLRGLDRTPGALED
jgi:hypothetical protein